MLYFHPFHLTMRCILSEMLLSSTMSLARTPNKAAMPNSTQVDRLFEAARSHMGVERISRSVVRKGELQEIDYDLPDRRRYATALVDAEGRFVEFSVNSPDDGHDYKPIRDRGAFIQSMLELLSPECPAAERVWAVRQLDDPARRWTPSFPIVIGRFVYRLSRANLHDHFVVAAADAHTPGWRYPK